jgi:hypothetical protein
MAALVRTAATGAVRSRGGASRRAEKALLRIFCCICAALVLCLILSFVAVEIGGDWTVAGFLVLANIFTLLVALFLIASDNKERTAAFIALIYMTLFYLVPGYFHVSLGKFPFYAMNYPADDIIYAAIVVMTFTIVFLLGYWCFERFAISEGFSEIPRPTSDISRDAGLAFPIALAVIAIVGALGMGISYDTTSLGDVEYTLSPLLLVEITSTRILSFAGFALALCVLYRRRDAPTILTVLVTFGIFAILNSPLAIPRYILFSYLITLIATFSNFMERKKLIFLAAFFVAELTIFPAVSILSRGDPADLFGTSIFDYFISNGDFDGLQSTINVIIYVEKAGLKWGVNLLSALLFFVPREMWPGKSIGTGGESATFIGYDFINISSPLPSEFFVDFGIIGVVVGAAIFGGMLAYVDKQMRRARRNSDYLGLLQFSTIVGYLFIILRGSLVGVIGPFVLSFGLLVLTVRGVRYVNGVTLTKRSFGRRSRARRAPIVAER